MDRRNFVKRVLATATVGAVAPKLLAEPQRMTTVVLPLFPSQRIMQFSIYNAATGQWTHWKNVKPLPDQVEAGQTVIIHIEQIGADHESQEVS